MFNRCSNENKHLEKTKTFREAKNRIKNGIQNRAQIYSEIA